MAATQSASKPRSSTRRPPQPPLCEGWIDKYALCRGMFASKGWHRRYAFLTVDGIGFCHSNPREKGGVPSNRPLKPSAAKSFIPFARKRRGEVELEPVYVIDDVSAARHPAVPQRSHNGICSESVSTTDGGSVNVSARDVTKAGGAGSTFYYFGLTFEEHHKRYLLLLRTDSAQDYIRWTTFLPLYVHEGSATRIVPLGHPLEAGRPQPVDMNHRRLTDKRESTLPSSVTFYFDPDPCTAEEYVKVRRMCLSWDEGEREHLFQHALARVAALCSQSGSNATESLTEMQVQSEEEFRQTIGHQFDILGPGMPAYEAQNSPHSKEYASPNSSSTPAASPNQASRHVDATDIMADDASGPDRSKHLSHTFAAAPVTNGAYATTGNGRATGAHQQAAKPEDTYSRASRAGATV